MWIIFLFAAVIVLLSLQNICFKQFNRLFMANTESYFIFSSLYFFLISFIFLVAGIDTSLFVLPTIALGLLFAVSFICAMFFYMKALENGPLGLSFLFFSAGMLLPILFGIIVYNEPAPLHKAVGLALLFVAFFISTRGNSGAESGGKLNRKWVKFILLGSFSNGVIGIALKMFGTTVSHEAINEFLFLAFGQAAIIALTLGLILTLKNKSTFTHFRTWPFVLVVLGAGISTAGGNYIMVQLSLLVSAIVQFPVVSGALVITSIIASRVLFKEQVTVRHLQAIAVGVVAIVLLSI